MPPRGPPQAAEYKGDPVRDAKVDDVCDNLSQTARNLLILKRRDVRVVEGARLESVCRGNSTVGSNPTLSASPILLFPQKCGEVIERQFLAAIATVEGLLRPLA